MPDEDDIKPEKENKAGDEEEQDSSATVTEAQILNVILNSRSMSIASANGLDNTYFPGYEDEFVFIKNHFDRYGKVPDITTFLDKFPEFPSFDLDEAEAALVFKIKEAKGYSLLAPALRDIDAAAKEDSIEAARLMGEKAEEILREVSIIRFSRGMDLFKEAELRYMEYIRRMERKGLLGCVFGIKSFDELTGGVWDDDFLGIVGRPGEGKSWILEFLLLNAWRLQNKRVLMFSLENSKDVIGFRADSLLEHFSNFALMTGNEVVNWYEQRPSRTSDDYRQYIEKISRSDVPFEVLDNHDSAAGFFTIEDILEIADQKKPDIIAIDQLSLVGYQKIYKDLRQAYIHTTRAIRNAVNELKIPIYLNCQAGRDSVKMTTKSRDNTPELHQIAESDSVGQDATKILSLRQMEGILKLTLKKNTKGRAPLDSIMAWDIDTGRLTPASLDDLKSPTEKF